MFVVGSNTNTLKSRNSEHSRLLDRDLDFELEVHGNLQRLQRPREWGQRHPCATHVPPRRWGGTSAVMTPSMLMSANMSLTARMNSVLRRPSRGSPPSCVARVPSEPERNARP